MILYMNQWSPDGIRKLRGKYKLSRKGFSELLGITENYVYLLERGVKTPSKTLELLLDCMKRELKEKRRRYE